MKVLKASVDWKCAYANHPGLRILVDRIPGWEEMLFEEKENCYFSECEGFVKFFYYRNPGDGFGGRHFSIKMKNGEEKILIGPWSTNSGRMNTIGFTPSIEVSITDEPKVWERGHTFWAGAITLELAEKVLEEFLPEVKLYHTEWNDYYPMLKDGRMKPYQNIPLYCRTGDGICARCSLRKGAKDCAGNEPRGEEVPIPGREEMDGNSNDKAGE